MRAQGACAGGDGPWSGPRRGEALRAAAGVPDGLRGLLGPRVVPFACLPRFPLTGLRVHQARHDGRLSFALGSFGLGGSTLETLAVSFRPQDAGCAKARALRRRRPYEGLPRRAAAASRATARPAAWWVLPRSSSLRVSRLRGSL